MNAPQIIGPAVDISASQIAPSFSIDSKLDQPVQHPIIGIPLLQFRLEVCPRALPIAACFLQFAAQVGPDCAGGLMLEPSSKCGGNVRTEADNRGGNM
jgi:hypothetical protein